jgi:iron complex outermembrane receptor protein
MKRVLIIILAFVFIYTAADTGARAQTSASTEGAFALEEILVTAEKRQVNLQAIPSSVVAIEGDTLVEQGKLTTAQMLENVPNLTYRTSGGGPVAGASLSDNPDGNIAIRGVQSTQQTGGIPGPSATAIYVDEVYQGIGGDLDINRVEVLSGPQGTLYGRSATGGVVAFHTNDPKLNKVEKDLFVEYGTGSRINTQAVLNIPVGDTFSLRVAARYLHQDEGYFNFEGGENETKEGRIKALYKPTDRLNILLSLSTRWTQRNSGGPTATLVAADTIDYNGQDNPIFTAAPQKANQGSLKVDYSFGGSDLTWISAVHDFDASGDAPIRTPPSGSLQKPSYKFLKDRTHTEELRWASNTEGPLTWLVGANYYDYIYNVDNNVFQLTAPGDIPTLPGQTFTDVWMYSQYNRQKVTNYGLFTEETYKLRDDIRITGGLRYDRNKVDHTITFPFNINLTSMFNSYNLDGQPNMISPTSSAVKNFKNITYKARLEYDLRPENMLYLMTATGFLPGDLQFSPIVHVGFPGQPPTTVTFQDLSFDQERLTSYEIGTKNRFFDKRLQLNGAVFYYDYEGYQEAVNIGQGPIPSFVIFALPVKMIGVEMDGQWLITPNDKASLSAGWLDAYLSSYPTKVANNTVLNTKDYLYFKQLPGIPKIMATLGYDHTFLFNNGSILTPHAEFRYTGGYYINQLSLGQVNLLPYDPRPYDYQSSNVLTNLTVTWTSSDTKFSMTGYIRNLFDKEYKAGLDIPSIGGPPGMSQSTIVTPGDPRTWGVMLRAKF